VLVAQLNLEPGWRGGENQALLLARGLRDKGISQIIIATPGGILWKKACEASLATIPLRRFGEWDFFAAYKLRTVLRSLKPDVLQVHTAHDAGLAAVATRGLPTRLVIIRTVDFPIHENPLSRWKYRQADRIVGVSRCVAEGLKAQGFEGGKIVTIYPCLDLEEICEARALSNSDGRWRKEFLAGRGVTLESRLVGMFGALTAQKDPLTYIEAANLCARENPGLHFILVGEGGLRGDVEKRIRSLGLEKRVTLLGFRPDALRLMASVDCVAVSSVNEGLNLTVLEAAALGIPVVATRAGGVPEAVRDGETGFLVPPSDFKAMAERISELMRGPELRRRMGGNAVEFVKTFGVEPIVDQYIELFHDLREIR
jgi:glycosyltransferase involved in cell wall biosynthesis